MPEPTFSINLVSQLSGLSTHVIRAWERRYGVVTPERTESGRRLYGEKAVRHLRLLAMLTQRGHRIGDIARLNERELEQVSASHPHQAAAPQGGDKALFEAALQAVQALDEERLREQLDKAIVLYGQHGYIRNLIAPLAQELGTAWAEGSMTAAHEHMASHVMRLHLLSHPSTRSESLRDPLLLSCTPLGQQHELGAAIVAASARDLGWRVLYLGPSLPAAEIASAAVRSGSSVVALSILHPSDDPGMRDELRLLRGLVPMSVDIIAGGRASEAYAEELRDAGIRHLDGLEALYAYLENRRLVRRPKAEV